MRFSLKRLSSFSFLKWLIFNRFRSQFLVEELFLESILVSASKKYLLEPLDVVRIRIGETRELESTIIRILYENKVYYQEVRN